MNTFTTLKHVFTTSFEAGTLPSSHFRLLPKEELFEKFKPIAVLEGNSQRTDFHPEEDTFEHVMQVIDSGYLILISEFGKHFTLEEKAKILFALLVHDVGKDVTQEYNADKGYYSHIGHEAAGVPIVQAWLAEMGEEAVNEWSEFSSFTTRYHGVGHAIQTWGTKKILDFAKKVQEEIGMKGYLVVISADNMGRVARGLDFLSSVTRELHPNTDLLSIAYRVKDRVKNNPAYLLSEKEVETITQQVLSNTKIPKDKRESALTSRLKKEQEKKYLNEIERIISEKKRHDLEIIQ